MQNVIAADIMLLYGTYKNIIPKKKTADHAACLNTLRHWFVTTVKTEFHFYPSARKIINTLICSL